jgi:uncharacterized protein (DUF58 family)
MNRAEVQSLSARFTLRVDSRRLRGRAGERLGSGVGSSLEFQDYREYVPGDDVRHVDWAAFARRDELVVRLHREEISPSVEIILDTSASMASSAAKCERAREIATLIFETARRDRLRCILWVLGAGIERLDRSADIEARLERWTPAGALGIEALAQRPPQLTRRSIRVLVSDLLVPADPDIILRPLARDAASISVVQVLDTEEEHPDFRGGTRLEDVESGGSLDLVVSEEAVARYRKRLLALREAWSRSLRRNGGELAAINDAIALDAAAVGPLRDCGLLAVRGVEGGGS